MASRQLQNHSARQAEQLCRGVLKRREDHLGDSHPETLLSVWTLAALLEAKGSFAEAGDSPRTCVVAWSSVFTWQMDLFAALDSFSSIEWFL